jgi:hypothetical protein
MAEDIGGFHLRTITATAYRRPHLLKAMLETLLANELSGWRILIQIDASPVADDMARMAESLLDGHDRDIAINSSRLGVRENPYRLLERVFAEGSALNLYLEEDLLLSPDATRLASWYETNHCPEWLCLNLIAGGCASAGLLSNPDFPTLLFTGPTFNSLGFAVRRQEWQRLMAPAWMRDREGVVKFDGKATGGWDWQIFSLLLEDPHLRTLQPVLARSVHNGRLAGEHCTPRFHDLAFAGLPIYQGAAAADYRLVAAAELPSVVRRHAFLWAEMSSALRALALKALHPVPGAS